MIDGPSVVFWIKMVSVEKWNKDEPGVVLRHRLLVSDEHGKGMSYTAKRRALLYR